MLLTPCCQKLQKHLQTTLPEKKQTAYVELALAIATLALLILGACALASVGCFKNLSSAKIIGGFSIGIAGVYILIRGSLFILYSKTDRYFCSKTNNRSDYHQWVYDNGGSVDSDGTVVFECDHVELTEDDLKRPLQGYDAMHQRPLYYE